MSKITVKTTQKRFSTAPDLYGLFFEDINRAGDSGLYPEMLRNRSFEDSIPPERCTVSEDGVRFTTPKGWSDQFNNGEGLGKWLDHVPPTPVPAWYAEQATMSVDETQRLNSMRLVSLKTDFEAGGSIRNIGYQGLALKKGAEYHFYMFAKAESVPVRLTVSIASSSGRTYDEASFSIAPDSFRRYPCTFTATEDDTDARLVITAPEAAVVSFGFSSLMPADTYKGHGLRKDLMELLAGTNSGFFRFPGGCIVEGFTYETAMRFPNTIGPVWERPSHMLMWHYRTTNGLGFHEYLQLCEDLDLEPLYVVNCGLTCQGRSPELFEGEELEKMLQETLDAVEYAIGDVATPYGKKRAEAGHPEPFKMTYIEIGNENHGPEYNLRYKMFYDALKAKHPGIKYIANTHIERDGLPTDIVDEHYYNTPEFFAENTHKYDDYDRTGPDIFVGEYAVTVGKVATLRCALGESMFLLGIENNQDIVRMTAYAPLFQNVGYTGWYPNLIAFDNHRAYGIPTYYALRMLAGSRGADVVAADVETPKRHRSVSGRFGILAEKSGLTFKDAAVGGKPARITHLVQGRFVQNGTEYTAVSDVAGEAAGPKITNGRVLRDACVFAVLGDREEAVSDFEVTVRSSGADNPVTLAVWCHRPPSVFRLDETQAEDILDMRSTRRFEWRIDGQTSSVHEVYHSRMFPVGTDTAVPVELEQYNTYKVVTRRDGFDGYVNGELVQQAYLPEYPAVAVSTTTDDDRVIVKLVNITNEPDDVEIILDCPVQSGYEVQLLSSADPHAENTLDNPTAVVPVVKTLTGASRSFTYRAPENSLSILTLRR